MFIWIISVTVHVVKEEFDPQGLFLKKISYVSRPGGWKPFREAHRRTTAVSPDPRINRTNQRLFNENKASLHIIISWTKPRSLIIHHRHPCLNCTAATTHPSHTVSGTANTAFSVIEFQKWAGRPSLSSIHRRRATAISFRSLGVVREMSVCHLKQSTWESARRFWSSLSKKLFDYSAVIYGARLPSVEKKKVLTNCSPFLLNKPLVNITETASVPFFCWETFRRDVHRSVNSVMYVRANKQIRLCKKKGNLYGWRWSSSCL